MHQSAREVCISIHAPREGGDDNGIKVNIHIGISIHAPREGGDIVIYQTDGKHADFNPRPPRGGRLKQLGGFPCG